MIAAVALAAITLTSTSANILLERRERSRITPYGERVPVAGGAINVWRSGRAGRPAIVLLSGLGTAAPALDFAPLIRELDDYDVVVIEQFGYGYSDMRARPRTIENITAELHEVLSGLDVEKPFVLAGHSIAGFYTLSYADRYPDEVSAVIGIDPTLPDPEADVTQPGDEGVNWGGLLRTTGVVRAVLALAPDLALPDSDAYTPDELTRMGRMAAWNYSNPAVVDETRRIGSNATALRGVTYPDELPVLHLLAGDTVRTSEKWVERHEDQLRDVRRHEVVVLDGPHYLHWTRSKEMAEKIGSFLGTE